MLVVQSLNQSNLTSAHADCILFRPLKFGWSTYIYILQSRGRFLRPACNSHPFRSEAWPLKASKVQLNPPGDRAENQARCWKGKKLLSVPHLFISPSTSQLLSPEFQNVTLSSVQCPKKIQIIMIIKSKTRYV